MKINNYICRLSAALMFLSLASCSTETIDEGYGYLDVSLHADVDIEDATRAPESLPESEYDDYSVMLYDNAGNLMWETSFAAFSANEGNIKRVPAGTYTVYVENCTAEEAEEGIGRPRFAGSQEFVVSAGRTTTATVACAVINAKITIAYDDDTVTVDYVNEGKSRVLYPAGLSISDPAGRRKLSLELSATHDDSKAVYYNVSESRTVSLTYTLVADVYADNSIMRYDIPFTAEQGKWNKVTMTAATVTGQ